MFESYGSSSNSDSNRSISAASLCLFLSKTLVGFEEIKNKKCGKQGNKETFQKLKSVETRFYICVS